MVTSIFMNTQKNSIGLGIMSGTSTDGIDLAMCSFASDRDVDILHFESRSYPESWQEKLKSAQELNGQSLLHFSNEYTRYTADAVNQFIHQTSVMPDFIGAHGHTIFHQPGRGFTYQMLNGAILCAQTGTTVVCDFRTLDIALGGQGAPLVPTGDRLLFGEYAACINLGGFSNISFEHGSKRIAYDVGPANLVLNTLAFKEGHRYDAGGKIAASGSLIPELLDELNALAYFHQAPPKSLGREWLEQTFDPILDQYTSMSSADLTRTVVEHIASQIAAALSHFDKNDRALFTGGGVHNTFLMERISALSNCTVHIPEIEISDGKEAIVFALLAKLRLEEKINTLASVTGASRDSSGGAVYIPF
jgi:anhydro-N-acetylmuramic acid kinase